MKLIPVLFGLVCMSILFISIASAQTQYVSFNGDFQEGSTLFSDSYSFDFVKLSGKDVYPIRDSSMNKRIKTCTTIYKEKTKRVCQRIDGKRKCSVITYEIPKTTCKYMRQNAVNVSCLNPNGEYTNQLRLENFYYSIDGVNWVQVPYQTISLYNETNLQFKLIIPDKCSPTYSIDKAIKLSS